MDGDGKQPPKSNAEQRAGKPNGGKAGGRPTRGPVSISNPNDVANLVLIQIDSVNAKKDELTIAVKGLADLTKQLVRAYGEHTKRIQELEAKMKTVEKSEGKKS